MVASTSPSALQSGLDVLLEKRERRILIIKELQELRQSTVFVFWNLDELTREDFFTLADMLEEADPVSDIDLIVLSPGGNGEAGYRIGHTFQQWAQRKDLQFRVIVPLYAKSAATILSLAAHELVMGVQSEIGPIDPQIPKYDRSQQRWRYIPAMAVFDGLKLVSEYIEKIPAMSRVFEEIIKHESLTLDDLGMLERARESGKQYGETLLRGGMIIDEIAARTTVELLSDYYKFHGHPIDAYEAEERLGLKVTHCSGNEWSKIKMLRDEYNDFVGQPGFIPGAVVTTAVETAELRSWRYATVEEDARQVYRMLELPDIWQGSQREYESAPC